MTEIKAIETVYGGYRFRSRLEARWACFFDALKIQFEYEKEGYDLGEAGRYLPDFWLPVQNCWIEIKPAYPPLEERKKLAALAAGTGREVFLFDHPNFDVPRMVRPRFELTGLWGRRFHPEYPDDDEGDCAFEFGTCDQCDPRHPFVGIWASAHWGKHQREIHSVDDALNGHGVTDNLIMTAAYIAARSARFEHGAQP